MAQRTRFKGDYKGIGKLLRSAQMQREMENRADPIKQRCEADSPRDSGQYAESFRIETGVRGGKKPRAQSKIINSAPNAAYVEWGTSRTPRFRVMGKAAGSE